MYNILIIGIIGQKLYCNLMTTLLLILFVFISILIFLLNKSNMVTNYIEN